jgi:UDP:flavonoid glycosyltransferase YjiC (YdhE family)
MGSSLGNGPTLPDNSVSPPARRKVVLATFGTHGDLHPFIAVALRLRSAGFEPVIATDSIYRCKVESAGIAFHRLRPEQETIERDLGMTPASMVRKVAQRPDYVLRKFLLPYLHESYEDSLAVLHDAAFVVTHTTALATKVAAEKLGVLHVAAVLQPMAMLSVFDPPEIAPMQGLMRWINARGQRWTSVFLRLMKRRSRSWASPIDELRREVGLPVTVAHPFFEGQFPPQGVIALYSTVLGALQPDHPPQTHISGFAFYDAEAGEAAALAPELDTFLDGGTAPIVFTLGTSAIHDADDFIRESLHAADKVGMRAVFVLDRERQERWQSYESNRVSICSYASYSMLFPRAAAIVHHGGVGTTAQALRSGRPQLIVPYLVDQPDNAARVQRVGAGITVPLRKYRAEHVAAELRRLLEDRSIATRADAVARTIAAEDGPGAAVQIISALLARPRLPAPATTAS